MKLHPQSSTGLSSHQLHRVYSPAKDQSQVLPVIRLSELMSSYGQQLFGQLDCSMFMFVQLSGLATTQSTLSVHIWEVVCCGNVLAIMRAHQLASQSGGHLGTCHSS